MHFVSAANGRHKEFAKQLVNRLDALGYSWTMFDLGGLGFGEQLPVDDALFHTQGYYKTNFTAYRSTAIHKPNVIAKFLRHNLRNTLDEFFVYLDADTFVCARIEEIVGDYDIGVTTRGPRASRFAGRVNAGVLFFRSTLRTRSFVGHWLVETAKLGNDQAAFNRLLVDNTVCRVAEFSGLIYNWHKALGASDPGVKIVHFKVAGYFPNKEIDVAFQGCRNILDEFKLNTLPLRSAETNLTIMEKPQLNKTLHYHLYNDGNIGLCNLWMSIECGLIIGKLTGRKVVFHGHRTLFNSKNQLRFSDLFDINYPHEFTDTPVDTSLPSLEYDFSSLVINDGDKADEEFKNGREHEINLKDYAQHAHLRTHSNMTLAFYSYLFYLTNNRLEMQEFIKRAIQPKKKYLEAAHSLLIEIQRLYGTFNSLHVRRGDAVRQQSVADRPVPTFVETVKKHMSPHQLLIIHSDESDVDYFKDLRPVYVNCWMLDKDLSATFPDCAEAGLVSLLIAGYSEAFMGTMKSTFTSMIQRQRLYNGMTERFNYTYPALPEMKMNPDGSFYEGAFGKNSWSRINSAGLKNSLFWYREHPECYPQKALEQSVRVIPDFVTKDECDYIIQLANVSKTDVTLEHQKRNRKTVDFTQDHVIGTMVKRVCSVLGYTYSNFEPTMQIFIQETGGGVELHTDSLFMDDQGMRIASVLFYLNGDYKGCELSFPNMGITINPKPGAMVVYPLLNEYREQDKRYAHMTTQVTEGVKYMCYISLKEKSK